MDYKDTAVCSSLKPGEVYSRFELRGLYRKKVSLRDEEEVIIRIEQLAKAGVFENAIGGYRYVSE